MLWIGNKKQAQRDKAPSLGVNKVTQTTHNCAKEFKKETKSKLGGKKTFRKYFGLQNEVEIQMFKTKQKKIKVRFGNCLAYLFSLFDSDTVLVLLHFRKEKFI